MKAAQVAITAAKIVRSAERKIGEAAGRERLSSAAAEENAQAQRGSSAPFAKEDHMNEELTKRSEEGDPSEKDM